MLDLQDIDHVSISCPSRVVSIDKKTYLDVHEASYIYFHKNIVYNFTMEGNLKVYEMTEDKEVCVSDILYYRANQDVCIRVVILWHE